MSVNDNITAIIAEGRRDKALAMEVREHLGRENRTAKMAFEHFEAMAKAREADIRNNVKLTAEDQRALRVALAESHMRYLETMYRRKPNMLARTPEGRVAEQGQVQQWRASLSQVERAPSAHDRRRQEQEDASLYWMGGAKSQSLEEFAQMEAENRSRQERERQERRQREMSSIQGAYHHLVQGQKVGRARYGIDKEANVFLLPRSQVMGADPAKVRPSNEDAATYRRNLHALARRDKRAEFLRQSGAEVTVGEAATSPVTAYNERKTCAIKWLDDGVRMMAKPSSTREERLQMMRTGLDAMAKKRPGQPIAFKARNQDLGDEIWLAAQQRGHQITGITPSEKIQQEWRQIQQQTQKAAPAAPSAKADAPKQTQKTPQKSSLQERYNIFQATQAGTPERPIVRRTTNEVPQQDLAHTWAASTPVSQETAQKHGVHPEACKAAGVRQSGDSLLIAHRDGQHLTGIEVRAKGGGEITMIGQCPSRPSRIDHLREPPKVDQSEAIGLAQKQGHEAQKPRRMSM